MWHSRGRVVPEWWRTGWNCSELDLKETTCCQEVWQMTWTLAASSWWQLLLTVQLQKDGAACYLGTSSLLLLAHCTEMFAGLCSLNLHFLRNTLRCLIQASRSVARTVIFYPRPQDIIYLWFKSFPVRFLPFQRCHLPLNPCFSIWFKNLYKTWPLFEL